MIGIVSPKPNKRRDRMSEEEMLAALETVGKVTIEEDADGNWMCKLEDVMVHSNGALTTAYRWGYTRESSIYKYFKLLTQSSMTLFVIDTGEFKKFDGQKFVTKPAREIFK